MAEVAGKKRPEYRNIHITDIMKYRLPPAGMMSIAHRVSGLALFVMIPFVLTLLDMSIRSEQGFEDLTAWVANPVMKLILCGLTWAYLHHFCAGIRHLLADLHIGLDKASGRAWAIAVFAVSLSLTALVSLRIFGVF